MKYLLFIVLLLAFLYASYSQTCSTKVLRFLDRTHNTIIDHQNIKQAFQGRYQSTVQFWIKIKEEEWDGQLIYTWFPHYFYVYSNRRTWFSVGSNYVVCNQRLTEQVWNHISLVQDGLQYRVYFNGKLQCGRTFTNQYNFVSDYQFYLGGQWINRNWWFNFDGLMSDFRIWNKALTSDQIQQNYKTRLTGTEEGLAFYYKLDTGTGSELKDLVQNNAGQKGQAQWVLADDLPIHCQEECPDYQYLNGFQCVNDCSSVGKINDESGCKKVCVDKCPSCSVHDIYNNKCTSEIQHFRVKSYSEGEMVQQGQFIWKCKGFPFTAWCSQVAYEPIGLYGFMAWTKVGGYSALVCPVNGNLIHQWMPDSNYKTGDIIASNTGKYFKCKPYPYTVRCNLEEFSPNGIYWEVAWTEISAEDIAYFKKGQISETISNNDYVQAITDTQQKVNESDNWKKDLQIGIDSVILCSILISITGFLMYQKKQKATYKKIQTKRSSVNEIGITENDIKSNDI